MIKPLKVATKHSVIEIKQFSFKLELTLNKTNKPTPAPASSPDIILPKLIKPDKYNSLIITDAAQFGIKPIREANKCDNKGLLSKKLAIRLISAKLIIKPKMTLNNNK